MRSVTLSARGAPGKREKGWRRTDGDRKRLPASCPRARGRSGGTSLLQSLSPVLFLFVLIPGESRGWEKLCHFQCCQRDKEVFLNLTGLTGSSSLTFSREERT